MDVYTKPHVIHNQSNDLRKSNLLRQFAYVGITDFIEEPPCFLEDSKEGVAEAHMAIVRKHYDEPEITIFEDDIVFTSSHSWEVYAELYKELPDDWDVYLGGHYNYNKIEPQEGNLNKLRHQFSGLHHYTIRKKFYDTFLACKTYVRDGKKMHIDRYIGQTNAYVYAPKLLLSRQMSLDEGGFSERMGKPVRYSGYHDKLNYFKK